MKRYTDSELISMTEGRARKLFESGKMDDDDYQRKMDLDEESKLFAFNFVTHELKYWKED